MDYVKGCDFYGLSGYSLKKIADGRICFAESLRDVLSFEALNGMFAEAKTDFTDGSGKVIKGMPSAEIFVMTKKINKKKYIIGLSYIRRIAGEPSGKKGIESWFENSPDRLIEEKRFFAEEFEKEQEYFDQLMIDHFRNHVGSGQACEAEYKDKIITRVKTKKILGMTISTTAIFIAMMIIWGMIFKNFALGIIFALCMTGSFTLITTKAKSEEKVLAKTQING